MSEDITIVVKPRPTTLESIEKLAFAIITNAKNNLLNNHITQYDFDTCTQNVNRWLENQRSLYREIQILGPNHNLKKVRILPGIKENTLSYDDTQDVLHDRP